MDFLEEHYRSIQHLLDKCVDWQVEILINMYMIKTRIQPLVVEEQMLEHSSIISNLLVNHPPLYTISEYVLGYAKEYLWFSDFYEELSPEIRKQYLKFIPSQVEVSKLNLQNDLANIRIPYFKEIVQLVSSLKYMDFIKPRTINECNSSKLEGKLKACIYIDMGITALIHQVCNDELFENIAELDLYLILNLKPCDAVLHVKPREKVRTCYLIYKLYDYVQREDKFKWRTYLLEQLGIKESFYSSKYKEPTSDISSLKSQDFVTRIDRLFANRG